MIKCNKLRDYNLLDDLILKLMLTWLSALVANEEAMDQNQLQVSGQGGLFLAHIQVVKY